MTTQKISVNDILFTSIRAGVLAGVICLLLLFPSGWAIKTGAVDERNGPLLVASCAAAGGLLSGIILKIGKRGRAATALCSAFVVTLILLILSAGIRQTGKLPVLGILPFSGAFAGGFGLGCIMQNNKKDRRRE